MADINVNINEILKEKPKMKRFSDMSEDLIDDLVKTKVAKKTVQSTETSMRIFTAYCKEKGFDHENTTDGEDISNLLVGFYANIKNQTGGDYKVSSIRCIRFGVARFYKEKQNIDIINDPGFTKANDVYYGKIKQLDWAGLLIKMKLSLRI